MKKVIIIGSGPAAYTAAIYAGRAGLNPLVITGLNFGGQLMITETIENFPGFPDGISGKQLMIKFHEQMEKYNVKYLVADVKSVELKNNPFKVNCSSGECFETKSIIIATGAKAKWLGMNGEKELRSNGISTCATCDGAFYKNKKVIVVGGGDSAMEDALYLAKHACSVVVINRTSKYRASTIMLNRARANEKITFIENKAPTKWDIQKGVLKGVYITDFRTNSTDKIECDGAFLAIGHIPATRFLEGQVVMDLDGYIMNKKYTMTSVEGVFSCGDVCDNRYRQAITASGQGCQAAMDCERWLNKNA